MRPAIIRVVAREDPPAEKKGRGIPVAGRNPETTAIFTRVWDTIMVTRPQPRRRENVFSFPRAALYPRAAKTAKRRQKSITPKKPDSSAKEEKIKSE
jgi:hypothetical protein